MKSSTKLLSIFTVLLFIGSLAAGSISVSNGLLRTIDSEQVIPAETYGDDRRNDAVSILIQTQFVDTRVDHEWDKVLTSLKGSLYGKFTYDNLTDYTQLGSVIDEYDALLIPENENGNISTSNMIAGAWSSFLPTYVENGGIVICMTFANIDAKYGITTQILNGTGLMELYNPTLSNTHQIDLFSTSDALARNMPASYTGVSGTVCFDTWDGTVVMKDNTNGKAVVVHKTIGKGHVIMLGFDMWTPNINQDRLLANAVRLHNHVMVDNSHTPDFSINDYLSNLANDLPYEGFAVSQMNFFSAAAVEACDILVIVQCVDVYTTQEMAIIDNFLSSGGALFIGTEVSIWGNALDPLLDHFGYARKTYGELNDTDDYHDDVAYIDLYPENLNMHSTKVGVDIVEVHSASAFITMPESAVPILTTDDDGTVSWHYTHLPPDPAGGLPIAAVETIGNGRIALVADNSLYTDYDVDSDGSDDYYDSDNELFMHNIFRWLAGAGIPEQTVVFDYSNSPWGYLHSTIQPLAEFLMFNGYNVIWTDEFDPDVYDTADILFICDGASDYNTSEIATIENYVDSGGALLLWGDWGSYGMQIEPIAQEFGLLINTTGILIDTDDYLVSPTYVIYEGTNLGTHPIMDGVDRIEVDWSNGFISIGSGTALVSTDNDGTAEWNDGTPANNLAVFAATTYNQGRVAVVTDLDMGTLSDTDSDGFGALYDSDNSIFIANVFKWLAENRAPTVEVTYPNGGEVLSGVANITWTALDLDGDSLTFNVSYSANNGSSWISLATNSAQTWFLWNTALSADGSEYLIRVVVSDGGLTSLDVSDDTFTVENVVSTTTTTTTSTSTTTTTTNGTGWGGSTTTIIIIIIAGGVVIIIIIIIMKKKK